MTKLTEKTTEQLELFERNPTIRNFGIVDITLKDGRIEGKFIAATEASDLAQLSTAEWRLAYAEILLKLCACDLYLAQSIVETAFLPMDQGQAEAMPTEKPGRKPKLVKT